MKLILKNILNNRILLLGILDLLIIFWIIWNEGSIQYEPPLYDCQDSNVNTLPLIPETYNTIIVTIIANIIVLISEIGRLFRKTLEKDNFKVMVAYFVFAICFLAWGYFHISSRSGSGVISEYNALFEIPVMLIGKNAFESVITVINLYISLCVIHICSCIVYISKLLSS